MADHEALNETRTSRVIDGVSYREYLGPGFYTVFLTGSSRGIGAAIFDALRGSYNIIGPGRDEMDLSDPDSVKRYIVQCAKAPVDIIINDAGVNYPSALQAIDDGHLNEMMQVNLISPLRLVRGLTSYMIQRRYGRIVNISSIAGVVGREKRTPYTMTKFGINGMTASLALELGPYGITVNSVCPGFTDTELTQRNVPPEEREKLTAAIALRRFAEPAEIASVVRFLISREASYITGQCIVVDGGFTAQ